MLPRSIAEPWPAIVALRYSSKAPLCAAPQHARKDRDGQNQLFQVAVVELLLAQANRDAAPLLSGRSHVVCFSEERHGQSK